MPTPRPNPKLMAIGDSLPQGCRHLTVKASFCGQSWPARVAQSQGWEFVSPDHRQPILFDLEEEIRRLDIVTLSPATLRLIGLPKRVKENFLLWQQQPGGSASECFDNLAVAGGKVFDLYSQTSFSANEEIKRLTPNGVDDVMSAVGDLHNPINARFVLNPQQRPDYMNFTALDWVEKREPETLIVHCGHNHGLFSFGFEAKDQPSITQGTHEGLDYYQQWEKVASRLADLSATVKRILVVQLPKVGAVAALQPTSNMRVNGYAPHYEPRVIPVSRTLSGKRVSEVDAMIREANTKIEKILRAAAKTAGTEKRLIFLSAYTALDSLDYKNSRDETRRLVISNKKVIDNRYLDGRPKFPEIWQGTLDEGGYLSIDGMHASGAGYADLASRALTALGLPHTAKQRSELLERGFDEDTLLSNYPLELDGLLRLIDIARNFVQANHFVPEATSQLGDETHLSVALPMMARAFTRTGGATASHTIATEAASAQSVSPLFNDLVHLYATMDIEFPELKVVSIAQWMLESGRGTSALCQNHLNFGGLKYRPEMAGWATRVYYEAHDGGDYYCSFDSLRSFIRGYWHFMDRTSYNGWRDHTSTGEDYIRFIGPIYDAPPYAGKVIPLMLEAANLLDAATPDDANVLGLMMPALSIAEAPAIQTAAGTIVIDPGHGGTQTVGGSSPNNATARPSGIREKAMTLDMALRLRTALQALAPGVNVILTRETDVNVGISARANVAATHRANLFLSIHFNGSNSHQPRGVETWIRAAANGNINHAQDRAFAQRIQAAAFNTIEELDPQTRNRGVKNDDEREDPLGVLNDNSLGTANNGCLACLVELEFIDVPAVDALFNTSANASPNKDRIARALASALVASLPSNPAGAIVAAAAIAVAHPKKKRAHAAAQNKKRTRRPAKR